MSKQLYRVDVERYVEHVSVGPPENYLPWLMPVEPVGTIALEACDDPDIGPHVELGAIDGTVKPGVYLLIPLGADDE